jgi:hypothetical protein
VTTREEEEMKKIESAGIVETNLMSDQEFRYSSVASKKKEKKTIEIIREEDIQYLHKVWKHGECFRASNTAAYGQSVSLFYAITHV